MAVNSTISLTILVCVIAIIVVATNRKMSNTEIASAEGAETMQEQEEQSKPKALTEIKAREPNTNNFTYVTSEDEIQVPVPKGYVASPDAEERYVNGITTDGVREHHGGVVIYEKNAGETDEQAMQEIEDDIDTAQRERNQWVWVPIADVTDMYHISANQIYANTYTYTSNKYSKSTSNTFEPALTNCDYDQQHLKYFMENISRNEFLQEMREEFYEMIESVKTYGGFYIGRYETGNINQNKPVVVKGNSNIGSVKWYKMYLKCRSLKGRNPVHTGLVWGIQYDETLKWIIDTGEKSLNDVISDSTEWGNYILASFTYTNANGGISTKNLRYSEILPTGSTDRNMANNVYDLAGNVFEWTMESDNSYVRYLRGGSGYGNGRDYPACIRYNGYRPIHDNKNLGCRATLYIM